MASETEMRMVYRDHINDNILYSTVRVDLDVVKQYSPEAIMANLRAQFDDNFSVLSRAIEEKLGIAL